MSHAVLPLFVAETPGASTLWIGLTEGLGEGAALLTKVVSGALADRFGHKKLLVFLGYALGVVSKPFFAVAGSLPVVLAARVGDRIGKGLRGTPRDALVADVTPEAVRGAAYGLRQSLDAAGAFFGPLLATGLLLFWTDDFRAIFWFALIPGVLCLLLILFGVEERATTEKPVSYKAETKSQPESAGSVASMRLNLPSVLREPAFRALVLWGCLLSIARLSNAFLVLRAADADLAAVGRMTNLDANRQCQVVYGCETRLELKYRGSPETSSPIQSGFSKGVSSEGSSISATMRPAFTPKNSSTSHIKFPIGILYRFFSMTGTSARCSSIARQSS